jgi:hypothetical protein
MTRLEMPAAAGLRSKTLLPVHVVQVVACRRHGKIACKKTPMARTIFRLPSVVIDNLYCNISRYSNKNGESR